MIAARSTEQEGTAGPGPCQLHDPEHRIQSLQSQQGGRLKLRHFVELWNFLPFGVEVVPEQIGSYRSLSKQCSGTLKTTLINFGLMINLTNSGRILDVNNS